MAILEAKAIFYAYQNGRQVLAEVEAEFEAGKMYAVLGPSGSGKSTLLALLGGLDVPQQGAVLFNNENILQKGLEYHRRRHISFIFQNYNLIDYMTALENVALTARQAAAPLLERLGLTAEEAGRNVLKLSGGQQQRVAIARALASDKPVILADEPTGNLDAKTAEDIVGILQESASKLNRCVIVVSHSRELAEQADVVLQLVNQRLCRFKI